MNEYDFVFETPYAIQKGAEYPCTVDRPKDQRKQVKNFIKPLAVVITVVAVFPACADPTFQCASTYILVVRSQPLHFSPYQCGRTDRRSAAARRSRTDQWTRPGGPHQQVPGRLQPEPNFCRRRLLPAGIAPPAGGAAQRRDLHRQGRDSAQERWRQGPVFVFDCWCLGCRWWTGTPCPLSKLWWLKHR